MLDLHKNARRTRPSPSVRLRASLLPLRIALTIAERESPARPRRLDSNERLAMQLIARMQAGYKKADPFIIRQDDFREMAGSNG